MFAHQVMQDRLFRPPPLVMGRVRRRGAQHGFALQSHPQASARTTIARHVDAELLPGRDVQTDDELIAYSKQYAASSYHLIGSCRMGRAGDPGAVVSPELKVHGLDCLHVADASVMPSANTMAPTLMVGEKAANMILGRARLPAVALRD